MCLSVEVTKKNREDMTAPPREGSYVYGLFMEGNDGAGLRRLPEPDLLGWGQGRAEGTGGRSTQKGRVSSRLDAGGGGGATQRMCPVWGQNTPHRATRLLCLARNSRCVLRCEHLSRGDEGSRSRKPGADGCLGAPALLPPTPPPWPGRAVAGRGTPAPHPHPAEACSLRPAELSDSFSTTNRPTQGLMPPPYLWGCQGLASKRSGLPSPHIRDKHSRGRSPCLFWNDRQETQTPLTG